MISNIDVLCFQSYFISAGVEDGHKSYKFSQVVPARAYWLAPL